MPFSVSENQKPKKDLLLLDYICIGRYSFGMKLKEAQVVFGALADATRLRVLNLLVEGELCVCDIMQVLKVPQSKISRHLSYLRRAGLVDARKEGLWMYYRLAKPQLKIFRTLFQSLDSCRSDFGELQKDVKSFRENKNCHFFATLSLL